MTDDDKTYDIELTVTLTEDRLRHWVASPDVEYIKGLAQRKLAEIDAERAAARPVEVGPDFQAGVQTRWMLAELAHRMRHDQNSDKRIRLVDSEGS